MIFFLQRLALESDMSLMCEYGAARFEYGKDAGREIERFNWLRKTADFLKSLKEQGLLTDLTWKVAVCNCPNESLLPKLRKAVGI